MNRLIDVIITFLQSLITFEIFLYFLVAVAIFGVILLIRKIVFALR